MAKRKRPVYIIVRPTGEEDEDGEEICIFIAVKATSIEAYTLANSIEGAIVKKGDLITM